MPTYVAEYVEELRREGADRLGRELMYPVLVLLGVAGTLRDQSRPGTLVTDLNETLTLSRMVGRVFPLVKRGDSPPGPIAVGRSSENDVAISDYSISQRHCHLKVSGPQVVLTDCGSTNGTVVDGRPAPARQPVNLQGGETVVLGRFAFLFLRPNGFLDYLRQQAAK
jgi:pSer/pThr/pTyr-binding forkhead associated (FHA) protein